MPQIILQKYSNREIRIGYQSIAIAPKKKGDKAEEIRNEKFAKKLVDLYVSAENLKGGYELGHDRSGLAIALPYTLEQHKYVEKRLDIRNEFQQRSLKPRKKGGWGFKPRLTSFGKNARHRILEAGAVMDKLHGKNVVEVTLTIPGDTKEIFQVVANWSGWIMNRVTQVIRRATGDFSWFYVWEHQDRGALHIHFAIGSSSLQEALAMAEKIKCKWFKSLLDLREKTNVDVFRTRFGWTWRYKPEKWQFHILPVYKSVAAYFSKYCGKHSTKSSGKNAAFCPARWWGSNQSIKKGIDEARFIQSIEVSNEAGKEAISFLRGCLLQFEQIKEYRYNFDLGVSKNGTLLGGGWREVKYYEDKEFLAITELLPALIEYVTQTWGIYADIPCLHKENNADIKYKEVI